MGWVGGAPGKSNPQRWPGGCALLIQPPACYIDPTLVYVALSPAPGPLSQAPLPATSTRPMLHKPLCSAVLFVIYTKSAPRHLLHKGSAPRRFCESSATLPPIHPSQNFAAPQSIPPSSQIVAAPQSIPPSSQDFAAPQSQPFPQPFRQTLPRSPKISRSPTLPRRPATRRRLCSTLFGHLLLKNTTKKCYIKVYVAPARFM